MDAVRNGNNATDTTGTAAAARDERRPSISLVLPAYNEEEVIARAIAEADEALAALCDDYEIIVVDDGSADATRQIAEREAGQRRSVRVLAMPQNRGYGAALRAGFQAATKPWIGFTDADCQFDLRQIDRLALLLRDCDIACGYRIDRQDPWLRLVYSRVYNVMVRCLLGTGVRDVDCAFKLFRREALASILHETDGFLINAEMFAKARAQNLSVVEVGVTHRPRADGQSTVSVWHSFPVIQALFRFWWSQVLCPATTPIEPAPQTNWPAHRQILAVLALCLLAALMFFNNLAYPLIEPDESRYAQIALEMVQSGDYLVPRLAGEPYLDKPPLLYWATAAGFRWLDVNETMARLPSTIAGWLTVLATFLLGRRLVGDRAAFLGSLCLFLCLGFVLSSRFLIMDGLLTLFTTVSILATYLATRGSRVTAGWWLLAAATCGLGFMTKGPVAAVLALPPLLAAQWLMPDRPRLRARHWMLYAVVVLVIAGPWFVLIGQREGDFAAHFFWTHHFIRFVDAFNHREPFWYYLPVLLIGMFPASLLAGPLLVFLASRARHFQRFRTPHVGAILLAATWIVVFFSISECKLPTYVLPALPFLALLQGSMLSMIVGSNWSLLPLPRVMAQLPQHATTTVLVIGGIVAGIDLVLETDSGSAHLLNLAMIVVAGAALAYRLFYRWRQPAVQADWVFAFTVSLLVMIFSFQKFVPELARFRSVNANAAQLLASAPHQRVPVVYFDYPADSAALHLPNHHIQVYPADELDTLEQFLRRHPRAVVVIDRDQLEEVTRELADTVRLIPTRGARGRVFLSILEASTGVHVSSDRPQRR